MRDLPKSLLCAAVLIAGIVSAATAGPFIAGTQPSQRPAQAPSISSAERSGQWYVDALHGISRPYPLSLRFLEDQGNWYTPFTRPGMPGRYDIRGWHKK